MTFRSSGDLGSRLILNLAQVLRIEPRWLIEKENGFQWWAHRFAQSVWSDPPHDTETGPCQRVHCETDFLKGQGLASNFEVALAEALTAASLSAVLYDAASDQYRLHCSVNVTESNLDWVKRVMLAAMTLQVMDVERSADALASRHKLAPAHSSHPLTGPRTTPDNVLDYVDKFFKTAGEGSSKWVDKQKEWLAARDIIRASGSHCVTDTSNYLRAEFEWDKSHSAGACRLGITSQSPHPELGHGLSVTLTLPVMMPSKKRAHTVVEFNTLERTEWTECHDLGSWCSAGSDIAFHAFIPNISYAEGLLEDVAKDVLKRVTWANSHIGKYVAL